MERRLWLQPASVCLPRLSSEPGSTGPHIMQQATAAQGQEHRTIFARCIIGSNWTGARAHLVQEFLECCLGSVNLQAELSIAADGAFGVGRLKHRGAHNSLPTCPPCVDRAPQMSRLQTDVTITGAGQQQHWLITSCSQPGGAGCG